MDLYRRNNVTSSWLLNKLQFENNQFTTKRLVKLLNWPQFVTFTYVIDYHFTHEMV